MSRRSLTEMSRAVADRMRSRREAGLPREAASRRPSHVAADPRPELLDWVELKQSYDLWPAGTLGAIVDLGTEGALVEIADDRGRAIDLFRMPLSGLRIAPGRD